MTDDTSFLSLIGIDVAQKMGRSIPCWCGATSELVRLTSNRFMYVCFQCLTKHGAHQFSPYDPLGVPAEPEVRWLRIKCHDAMDRWRKLHGWSRNRAYRELALLMGLTRKKCHIGRFDRPACVRCLALLGEQDVKP